MRHAAWLIPKLIEGSGGHRTILQHAAALEAAGFTCSIYVESDGHDRGRPEEEIRRLFGYSFKKVAYGWNDIAPADVVFATIWYSAQIVRDLGFPCKKAYFVQDYEACFNPMGDAFVLAENSYRFGLHPITIGRWLSHHLRTSFGVAAEHFDFCADLGIYRPIPNATREKAVCFIYQPDKPRRCARVGVEALGIVKHKMPDVQIYLYGSGHKDHVWFPHTNFGLLKLDSCNALYNRSAVGLCISSSNPSRIPFEMMAAGLPVVELWRNNTLYDLPQEAVLLCDQTPESLAEGMLQLLGDPERRIRMGAAGLAYMHERPMELAFRQFITSVERLADGSENRSVQPLNKLYTRPAIVSKQFEPTLPAPWVPKTLPRRRRSLLNSMGKVAKQAFAKSKRIFKA